MDSSRMTVRHRNASVAAVEQPTFPALASAPTAQPDVVASLAAPASQEHAREDARTRQEPVFGHDFSQISVFPPQARPPASPPGNPAKLASASASEPLLRAAAGVPVADAAARQDATPAVEHGLQGSSSQPLDAGARDFLEPRLGHDFSQVRIHTDARADESAEAVNALAYTVGQDVVFRSGQYAPGTSQGRQLLAHELTHVVQQTGGAALHRRHEESAAEQGLPPPILHTKGADLPAATTQVQRKPGGVTEDPIHGPLLDQYCTETGAPRETASQHDPAFQRWLTQRAGSELRDQLLRLINAGNTNYPDFKALIQAATAGARGAVLADTAFLTQLRGHLAWDDFARCVQLLGRTAPTFGELTGNGVVAAALSAAWTAFNPGVNPPAGTQHEEGGWVYMNLITGALSVQRAATGGGASINLSSPPLVADSIVVAMFHTHPNLGSRWEAGPSPADLRLDAADGVPDIVVGTPGLDPAVFQTFLSGPSRRLHLAGNQGLPGAAGGVAPQAKKDGTYDER